MLWVLAAYQQNRHACFAQHCFGVTAQHHAANAAPAMRAHDDEVGFSLPGFAHDNVRNASAHGFEQGRLGFEIMLARERHRLVQRFPARGLEGIDQFARVDIALEILRDQQFVDDMDNAQPRALIDRQPDGSGA